MFCNATTFNQPLDNWNVSKVENMSYMFCGAKKFNQPLNSWDVSNVTDMLGMFRCAESFNQPLSLWGIENYNALGLPADYEKKLKTNEPVKAKKSIHR